MKRLIKFLTLSAFCVVCGFLFVDQRDPFGLTTGEARSLYGAGLGDFSVWDKYCDDIEDCHGDECDGDENSCSDHWLRDAHENPQQFQTSQCVYDLPFSFDCLCQSTTLQWTCSTVQAGCYWDDDNERCEPDEVGWGIQRAPQFCFSQCPEN